MKQVIAFCAGLAIAVPAIALAQTPSSADYIMKAGQSDAFEIQTGQLAATMAASAELKTFGAQMVEDHTKSTQIVQAAAAKSGLAAPSPTLSSEQQVMLAQLQAEKGQAFDRLYVKQQLTAHQQALLLQSSYAKTGQDSNLKAAAAQIVPVVTKHLNMLRNGHPAQPMGGM